MPPGRAGGCLRPQHSGMGCKLKSVCSPLVIQRHLHDRQSSTTSRGRHLRVSAAAAASTLSLMNSVMSASVDSSTAAANAASVLYSCAHMFRVVAQGQCASPAGQTHQRLAAALSCFAPE